MRHSQLWEGRLSLSLLLCGVEIQCSAKAELSLEGDVVICGTAPSSSQTPTQPAQRAQDEFLLPILLQLAAGFVSWDLQHKESALDLLPPHSETLPSLGSALPSPVPFHLPAGDRSSSAPADPTQVESRALTLTDPSKVPWSIPSSVPDHPVLGKTPAGSSWG